MNVTYFYTSREENINNRTVFDLRNGSKPFPSNTIIQGAGLMQNTGRRRAVMKMTI